MYLQPIFDSPDIMK
jgi:dynein heavy chain, axonemal